MGDSKTAIIISGMHRSGTSAIAGVVHLLGAALPQDLLPALPENPRGFFESGKVMLLNDQILSHLKSDWGDWLPLPDAWEKDPGLAPYAAEAARIVTAGLADAALVVIKDPRFAKLLPFWQGVLVQCGYRVGNLIPVRDPYEVGESLWARNGMPRQIARLSWVRHMLDVERDSRGTPRVFVAWDAFMQDWEREAARIARQLSISWPVSFDAARARVMAFLSPDLRHYRASPAAQPGAHLPDDFAQRLYVPLSALTRDADGAGAIAAIDAIRKEFLDARPILEPVVASLNGDRHRLAVERDQCRSRMFELEAMVADNQAAVAHSEALAADGNALVAELVRVRSALAAAQRERDAAREQWAGERREWAAQADLLNAGAQRLSRDAAQLQGSLAEARNHLRQLEARLGALRDLPLLPRLAATLRCDGRYFELGSVAAGEDDADSARLPHDPVASAASLDLEGLLALNGNEFVAAAYARILKREPDADGLSFYLLRLFGGEGKLRILAEIAASGEARAVGSSVPGLRRAVIADRLGRLPLVGLLLGTYVRIEGNSVAERRARAIEQALYLKNP